MVGKKDMPEDVERFIKKLTELTRKTGIAIGGCGCDGSPYIYRVGGRTIAYDLKWDKKANMYRVHED